MVMVTVAKWMLVVTFLNLMNKGVFLLSKSVSSPWPVSAPSLHTELLCSLIDECHLCCGGIGVKSECHSWPIGAVASDLHANHAEQHDPQPPHGLLRS